MNDRERLLEQSWMINAEAWTKSVRENQIESRKIATDQAILDEINRFDPKRVLDVGCGEGWLVRTLGMQGMEVVGMDGSLELINKAQSAGGGHFVHLNYSDLTKAPSRLGSQFDVIVCNFSLLSEDISTILQSLAPLLSADGVILIQTLHPFSVAQHDRYEDGWREESFTGMGEGYKSSMPWYYRTMGSWLNEVQADGHLKLLHCQEPINPTTGKPLSLLITVTKNTN
ncbi:class I SAM-dependent methyltransferase [Brevibacillus choshinensis]|uniref:class I SAM-dependent methyltransferase n=1 Tax=Brevibacillus choshinensis TaxID=54911 RepID=UPI002E1D72D4|nr:class I SAM-dependent methyltransferase [Brevibacillus choshinensis]